MMICENVAQLGQAGKGILEFTDNNATVLDEKKFRASLIDTLVFTAIFSPDGEAMQAARRLIRQAAASLGIVSTSIQPLYEAMGRREVSGITVPAINIRGLTYEVAQAVFRAAMREKVGPDKKRRGRRRVYFCREPPLRKPSSLFGDARARVRFRENRGSFSAGGCSASVRRLGR